MFNIINNLNCDSLIFLAKQYSGISFTKEELEPILPYLKSIYLDYYNNKDKRENYRNIVKSKVSIQTYEKFNKLLDKYNLK